MWFYPLLVFFGVLALVGIVVGGGAFTLILIPLAIVGLLSTVLYGMWARAQAANAGASPDGTQATDQPLPGRHRRRRGREPTRPERLVDARRGASTPDR